MEDFITILPQILDIFGALTTAILTLIVASRPLVSVLKQISKLTPWQWDDAWVKAMKKFIDDSAEVLRIISGVNNETK